MQGDGKVSEIKRLIKFFVDRIIEHYKRKDAERRDKILEERAKIDNDRLTKEMLELNGKRLRDFIIYMKTLINDFPNADSDTLERLYISYAQHRDIEMFSSLFKDNIL